MEVASSGDGSRNSKTVRSIGWCWKRKCRCEQPSRYMCNEILSTLYSRHSTGYEKI